MEAEKQDEAGHEDARDSVPAQEHAAAGEDGGKDDHLQKGHEKETKGAADQELPQGNDRNHQGTVCQGMNQRIFAGQMLRVFCLKIVVEHSGPVTEQNRCPEEKKRAETEKSFRALSARSGGRQGENGNAVQKGTQERGEQDRNGQAPQGAAQTGEKSPIGEQFRPDGKRQ